MTLKITNNGNRRIAVIKEIRTITGRSLRDAKESTDNVPYFITNKDLIPGFSIGAALHRLREAGATIVGADPSALDLMSAASFISDAEAALGNGELDKVRDALRSALALVGDI